MYKSILITGGCGFVGSNLAIKLKSKFSDTRIIAFDNLKRRGSELNISRLRGSGVEFIHGDLRNRSDLDLVGPIDLLIEAAAEPSVLAGIDNAPDYLLDTNLIGAINCLNYAVRHKAKIIFLSTSRVYPINHLNKVNFSHGETRFELLSDQSIQGCTFEGISEQFPLTGPRSLYGTSKLSAELLIEEYSEFYGLPFIINRCGVLAGPWQMGKVDQGVVVLWVARHFWKKDLSYIGYGGSGKQIRDVLHIDDLFFLIVDQMHNFHLYERSTFNVGGGVNNSVSLFELTELCQKVTGNTVHINKVFDTRQADIPVYITNNTTITAVNGWAPTLPVERTINDIHKWICDNEVSLNSILN